MFVNELPVGSLKTTKFKQAVVLGNSGTCLSFFRACLKPDLLVRLVLIAATFCFASFVQRAPIQKAGTMYLGTNFLHMLGQIHQDFLDLHR